MNNQAKTFRAQLFLATLLILMSCHATMVRTVQALPLTGTFEVIFNQLSPTPVPNAGEGTFTAVSGVVTSYEFEFTSPISEDFSGPPLGLTWDGAKLSGFDFAEYVVGGVLSFFGTNTYEISFPVDFYTTNLLGSICLPDFADGNCLAAVGTYTVNLVPEPSSLVLLVIGVAVNGLRRWRGVPSNRRS